jgi:hypothetical protein
MFKDDRILRSGKGIRRGYDMVYRHIPSAGGSEDNRELKFFLKREK